MRTNLQGSWATVGVLTEKGQPKLSAAGKNFMVWKLSSLDGALVSVFLFGGSYTEHWKESAGAVFAVFNAKVRLDERVRRTNKSPEQW
jgi:minichromosome maintenance protein 10